MRALLGTLDDLTAIAAAVDSSLGYPLAGRPVGAGRHVAAVTLHHRALIQHPTSGEWAYPVDDASEAVAVAQLPIEMTPPSRGVLSGEGDAPAVTPDSPVVELDETWFAPSPLQEKAP